MKSPTELAALFSKSVASGMMDWARLVNLSYWAMQCESIPGDVVEMGVNAGHTCALLAAITQKQVYAFDSFQGLPAKSSHDITDPKFVEGGLRSEQATFIKTFESAGLALPIIVPKWFEDVTDEDMPKQIAFCHLDSDFYHSVKESLRLVYPRMMPGAVCFVDDAPWTGLPGVKAALDEFIAYRPERQTFRQFRGPCGGMTMHAMFTKL